MRTSHNLLKIADILYNINLQEATNRKEDSMEKLKVSVSLELYREDLQNILFKLAADNIDLSTLITKFIGDLVASDYCRNGSDECDRADAYYDRCSYGLQKEDTFLQYLLESGEIENFIEIQEEIEAYKEWIQAGENFQKKLAAVEQARRNFYTEWAASHRTSSQDKEEAFRQTNTWINNYKSFVAGCNVIENEEEK